MLFVVACARGVCLGGCLQRTYEALLYGIRVEGGGTNDNDESHKSFTTLPREHICRCDTVYTRIALLSSV